MYFIEAVPNQIAGAMCSHKHSRVIVLISVAADAVAGVFIIIFVVFAVVVVPLHTWSCLIRSLRPCDTSSLLHTPAGVPGHLARREQLRCAQGRPATGNQ